MADRQPLIYAIQERWRRNLDEQLLSTTEAILGEWRRVELALDDRIFDLAEHLEARAAAGEEITEAMLYRLARYQRLLDQVQRRVDAYNQVIASDISRQQQQAIIDGWEHGQQMMAAAALPGAGRVAVGFDRLNAEAAEQISALLRNRLPPLRRILEKKYGDMAELVGRRLVEGAALGENPRKVARQILREGLSQIPNHTLLVARDQIVRANREAGRQAYLRSGVVRQYRRVCARNLRTCIACIALDGQIYEVEQLMELHPQDRCAMVPIVDGFDDPYDELGTAREWFDDQPEAVQRQMMGRAVFRLWDKRATNGIQWGDLATIKGNDIWGDSATPTSARALRAKYQLGADGLPAGRKAPAPPAAVPVSALPSPPPSSAPAPPVVVPTFGSVAAARDYFGSADHVDWNLKNVKRGDLEQAQQVAQLAAEIFQAHGVRFDLVGMDAGSAIASMRELQRLAGEWPGVMERLGWVGTYRSKRVRNIYSQNYRYRLGYAYKWGRGAMAHAAYQGNAAGRYIGLNPAFFGDFQGLLAEDLDGEQSGWLSVGFNDGGKSIIHEFGHLVDAWLRDLAPQDHSITPSHRNNMGLWGTLLQQVLKPALRELARDISQYASTSAEESFAEHFVVWDALRRGYQSPRATPGSVDIMGAFFDRIPELRRLLDENGGRSVNWYQSDPETNEQSRAAWNELMRAIGLPHLQLAADGDLIR